MIDSVSKFRSEIVAALSRELEIAKRVSSGERSNKLLAGKRRVKAGKSFLYEFEELIGFPPEEGVQISFSVKDKATNGRFLGEANSRFLFEVDEDLGESIDEATVVSDPLFLIQKQIDLLQEDGPFKSQVALSTLDLVERLKPETLNFPSELQGDLNSTQAKSLSAVSKNSVTYIWGPPGTGKTTTLGSVVAALLMAGKRVLLVSNTNLALDTALEKCVDRLRRVTALEGGIVLRLGTMVKNELINKYEDMIELDKVFLKKSEPINKEIASLTLKLQRLKNEISMVEEKLETFQKMKDLSLQPEATKQEISNKELQISTKKDDEYQLQVLIERLRQELKESESKSGLSRLFSGSRKPGQIKLDIDQKERSLSQIVVSKERLISEKDDLLEKQQSVMAEAKIAKKWLDSHKDVEGSHTQLGIKKAESQTMAKAIEALNEDLAKLRNQIISQAKVIACTAYRPLIDKDISGLKFDCVVVDEVSMLPLPLYFCSAFRATERIIVAGDFRQLPPIVRVGSTSKSDRMESQRDSSFRELMVSNPFTFSSVRNRLVTSSEQSDIVALRDQYRMRKSISDLISATFYPEHTLRTVNEKTDKPTPWGNESFIIFDTQYINPESGPVNGKSRRNIQHALVAQTICQKLFENGWSLDATSEKSFGLVSPYASQSKLIENMLTANPDQYIRGGVSTVHRFQGNERDLMIIDLTKVSSDVAPSLGHFIGHPEALAPENAMWNVAISRARQHVLVVADLSSLERDRTALISNLLLKLKNDIKVIDASELLDINLLGRPLSKKAKGSIAWFTSEGFYKAFESDLRRAREKVLIVSPFTSESAINRWMPTLQDLLARNISISILTRPSSEKLGFSDAEKSHELLQNTFTQFKTVSKMHEKISVIDQETVWLGSLNILSHHSASEVMVRIESADFAQSLINEYQSPRITGSNSGYGKSNDSILKPGEPCKRPGCGGVIQVVQGGYSKAKRKHYDSFNSCSRYRETGCKGQ